MIKVLLLLSIITVTFYLNSDNDLVKVNLLELEDFEFGEISDFIIQSEAIYIADVKSSQLFKFSLRGKFLKKVGNSGRGPGEFEYGPRLIASNSEKLFVNSLAPWLHVYDLNLNYIKDREVIKNALTIHDIITDDDLIIMAPTQFYEDDVFILNSKDGNLNKMKLDFKIESGLLSKFSILKFDNELLFAWNFKNEFKLYNKEFELINSYKIGNMVEYAPGIVEPIKVPFEPTSHQKKVYSRGTFTPLGTLFSAFITLDENTFIIQLGTEDGLDKCLIMSKKGEIIDEFYLPSKSKVLLAYNNGVLYMKDRKTEKVEAWKFNSN
jgi:hypothetical protein